MQISEESLSELIELYEKEFGKPISREDALEMGIRLVNLYLIIYRPLPWELDPTITPPEWARPYLDDWPQT